MNGKRTILGKRAQVAGFGLLEAVVGVGIMGVVIAGFATILKNQFAAQTRVQQRSDLIAIRNALTDRIDCQATVNALPGGTGQCPTSAFGPPVISVLDKNGAVLVNGKAPNNMALATVNGEWTLRALCLSSGSYPGLVIQAAQPKPASTSLYDANNADFRKDPLTGVALSWGVLPTKNFAGSELFQPGSRPCNGSFTTSTSTPPNWVVSPGGRCVTSQFLYNHSPPGTMVGAFTQLAVACPAAFPYETQTMVTPSGCACGWTSGPMLDASHQVIGGFCSEMMVAEQMSYHQCGLHPANKPPPGYTQAAWTAQIAASKACEAGLPVAQCTVTCCNL